MHKRKNFLKKMIKTNPFKSVYQAIFNLQTGKAIGFEALSRIDGLTDFNISEIIETCRIEDLLWDIELLLRNNAISNFPLDKEFMLFLNVDPHIINAIDFKEGITKSILENSLLSESNIIFEITERSVIDDYAPIVETLNYYKNQNYKVAIDDVGAGYSGFLRIVETKPDYIKIDMGLIRDIDKNDYKEIVVRSLVDISKKLNIKCIAEGIETLGELEKLIQLGVDYGQGFLLDKPKETPYINNLDAEKLILELSKEASQFMYDERYHNIGRLARPVQSFDKNEKTSKIKEYIDRNDLESICITDKNMIYGLITRKSLNNFLSKIYGNALYYNKSIDKITDKSPIIIDYFTPIFDVSRKILKRSNDNIYDNIIVTKCGNYHGTVSIIDLLKYSYARERDYYKELNPLTSLPGNPIINRVLNDSIALPNKRGVIYIDIDKFKPFNDKFGFELGDKLLIKTAKMLKDIIKNKFEYNSFIGHIGGDDFICILDLPLDKANSLCLNIINEFDRMSKEILRENKNTDFKYKNRDGRVQIFNNLSISICGFYGHLNKFSSKEILSEELGKLKQIAKSKEYSNYIISEI